MSDGITIDMSELRRSLQKVHELTGKPIDQIVRRQFNILMYNLALNVFPPHKMEQGKKAVARDVRKAVAVDMGKGWVASKNKRLAKRIKECVAAKNLPALNAIYRNAKANPSRVFVPFTPARHTSKRFQHTRGLRIAQTNPREVTLDKDKQLAHIRDMQLKVGRLKAGWLPGWLASLGSGGSRKLPAWITRHGTKSRGSAKSSLLRAHAWFEGTNHGPLLGRFEDGVREAMEIRATAMVNDAQHQLRRAKQAARL